MHLGSCENIMMMRTMMRSIRMRLTHASIWLHHKFLSLAFTTVKIQLSLSYLDSFRVLSRTELIFVDHKLEVAYLCDTKIHPPSFHHMWMQKVIKITQLWHERDKLTLFWFLMVKIHPLLIKYLRIPFFLSSI